MVTYNITHKNGARKEIADQIDFLIKYLMDLQNQGFTPGEMFVILGQITGSLLESHEVNEEVRMAYHTYVKEIFDSARSARFER